MKRPNVLSKRAARAISGPILIAGWGVPMVYFYAFASMLNPELSRREYYEQLFSQLYLGSIAIATVPTTAMLLVGIYYCLWVVQDLIFSRRRAARA